MVAAQFAVFRDDGEELVVVREVPPSEAKNIAEDESVEYAVRQQGDAADAWTFYSAPELRELHEAITAVLPSEGE